MTKTVTIECGDNYYTEEDGQRVRQEVTFGRFIGRYIDLDDLKSEILQQAQKHCEAKTPDVQFHGIKDIKVTKSYYGALRLKVRYERDVTPKEEAQAKARLAKKLEKKKAEAEKVAKEIEKIQTALT